MRGITPSGLRPPSPSREGSLKSKLEICLRGRAQISKQISNNNQCLPKRLLPAPKVWQSVPKGHLAEQIKLVVKTECVPTEG